MLRKEKPLTFQRFLFAKRHMILKVTASDGDL